MYFLNERVNYNYIQTHFSHLIIKSFGIGGEEIAEIQLRQTSGWEKAHELRASQFASVT